MRTYSDHTIKINGSDVDLYGHEAETLPDLDDQDWRDGADESSDNDGYGDGHYVYHLSETAQLEIDVCGGYPCCAHVESRRSELEALRDWWGNQGSEVGELAEWLVPWGWSDPVAAGIIDAATPDTEVCRIWREPHYYHGTYNGPTASYERVCTGDGQPTDEIWEGTYTEAEAYVADYMDAPSGYDGIPARNVLSHGQSSCDTLTIVATE